MASTAVMWRLDYPLGLGLGDTDDDIIFSGRCQGEGFVFSDRAERRLACWEEAGHLDGDRFSPQLGSCWRRRNLLCRVTCTQR